jgi:hypothetical protein
VELDAAERLRQALLDHGFYEAAALVEADIETQELEEAEELEEEISMSTLIGSVARRDVLEDSA